MWLRTLLCRGPSTSSSSNESDEPPNRHRRRLHRRLPSTPTPSPSNSSPNSDPTPSSVGLSPGFVAREIAQLSTHDLSRYPTAAYPYPYPSASTSHDYPPHIRRRRNHQHHLHIPLESNDAPQNRRLTVVNKTPDKERRNQIEYINLNTPPPVHQTIQSPSSLHQVLEQETMSETGTPYMSNLGDTPYMAEHQLNEVGRPTMYDTLDGGKGALDMYAGHQWCV